MKSRQEQICSDQVIVSLVKANTDKSTYEAWKCLTSLYGPIVRGRLRNLGVPNEQLSGIENEALAAFFHNALRGKFRNDSSVGTYLVSIASKIWFKRIRSSRKSNHPVEDANGLTLGEKIDCYLDNRLNGADKAAFEGEFARDTCLQEILAAARNSRSHNSVKEYSSEDMERVPDPVNGGEPEEDMQALVEQVFPPGSTCRTTLIEYYFVYEADYEVMVNAYKQPSEDFNTVYSRMRRRVSRCIQQIREALSKKWSNEQNQR